MRSNDTETIYYLYDREDRIGDYNINGNLLISYTHGPGIDEPVAMTINNSTYFYIPDIQGSIRAIIDINGNAVATYQYDAWGNLFSYNGTLAQHNDYLYTVREYDWQTGIYYYRARYYNPELGRFLSQDPAGMVDGANMYIYVKNDPVNGADARGKVSYGFVFLGIYIRFSREEIHTICNLCLWGSSITTIVGLRFPDVAKWLIAQGAAWYGQFTSLIATYGCFQTCTCYDVGGTSTTVYIYPAFGFVSCDISYFPSLPPGAGGTGGKGTRTGPGRGGIRHMGWGIGRNWRDWLIIGGPPSVMPPQLPPELRWRPII